MQQAKKDLFFYTDRESLSTFVYFKAKEEAKYTRRAYVPDTFETISNQQAEQFRRSTNLRFLKWAFSNKDKIRDATDKRIVTSQLIDSNFGLLSCVVAGFLSYKFLQRIDTPFLEMIMEDKFISLKGLRLASGVAITAFGLKFMYHHILDQKFLFDLSLEYKELFMPKTIVDSNVESSIQQFLPQI